MQITGIHLHIEHTTATTQITGKHLSEHTTVTLITGTHLNEHATTQITGQ